jgi:hypothetical protein
MAAKRKPTAPAKPQPPAKSPPAPAQPQTAAPVKPTKKDQILTLFASGVQEVSDLAAITQSRPSYIASVLQEAEKLPRGYFDLYTSTAEPMNLYSKFFAGKLSFKDVDAARKSVQHIDTLYRQFDAAGDRAGQHHALVMALTMFDRARWTGKLAEADVFRAWLCERLAAAQTTAPTAAVATRGQKK